MLFVATNRIGRLQGLMRENSVKYVLVGPGANLEYLTGITAGSWERVIMCVIDENRAPVVICPGFEVSRIEDQCHLDGVFGYSDEEGPAAALARALPDAAGGTAAADYLSVRTLELSVWRKVTGMDEFPADARPLISLLRGAKEPEEVYQLLRAAAAVQGMIGIIAEALKPGVSERELANLAENYLHQNYPGAVIPFLSVVGGERTSWPHAETGDYVLQAGDMVFADLGAQIEGYVADITRTWCLGEMNPQMSAAYAAVDAANAAARAAVKPGVTAGEIDAIARKLIADAGFGQYFTHRTGHGLGLEVHEEPYIVGGSSEVLRPGNVFTIEPGVYIPGNGGVRIEDDVLVTDTGCRTLTRP
jgi:Xaa-Pro aminopeptidase